MKVNVVMQIVYLAAASSLYADTAKFTALVIDDGTDLPISDVTVRANFAEDIGWRAWTESPRPDVDIKATGRDGRCRLMGKTNCGDVCCWVPEPPQGYYAGRGWGHGYEEKNIFGVWQPDNLVATIRLQRVEHPIPLCVKLVKMAKKPELSPAFDGTNTVWRYDLVVGDWLPPVGQGKIADMIMEVHSNFVEHVKGGIVDFDSYECSLSVVFPGNGNGIAPIVAKSTDGIKVRQAPASGYAPAAMKRFGRKRSVRGVVISPKFYSDEDQNRCYVFRIRSRYDEKGNLVEAYYGKIYGDFNFSKVWYYRERQFFLYYLNPKSLDRNLEWDMKNNLCPDPGLLGQLQP